MSFFGINFKKKYTELVYNHKFKDIEGNELDLNSFKNKVIIVVNVASECGFTKQYIVPPVMEETPSITDNKYNNKH